jgi:hypothetical protein
MEILPNLLLDIPGLAVKVALIPELEVLALMLELEVPP